MGDVLVCETYVDRFSNTSQKNIQVSYRYLCIKKRKNKFPEFPNKRKKFFFFYFLQMKSFVLRQNKNIFFKLKKKFFSFFFQGKS